MSSSDSEEYEKIDADENSTIESDAEVVEENVEDDKSQSSESYIYYSDGETAEFVMDDPSPEAAETDATLENSVLLEEMEEDAKEISASFNQIWGLHQSAATCSAPEEQAILAEYKAKKDAMEECRQWMEAKRGRTDMLNLEVPKKDNLATQHYENLYDEMLNFPKFPKMKPLKLSFVTGPSLDIPPQNPETILAAYPLPKNQANTSHQNPTSYANPKADSIHKKLYALLSYKCNPENETVMEFLTSLKKETFGTEHLVALDSEANKESAIGDAYVLMRQAQEECAALLEEKGNAILEDPPNQLLHDDLILCCCEAQTRWKNTIKNYEMMVKKFDDAKNSRKPKVKKQPQKFTMEELRRILDDCKAASTTEKSEKLETLKQSEAMVSAMVSQIFSKKKVHKRYSNFLNSAQDQNAANSTDSPIWSKSSQEFFLPNSTQQPKPSNPIQACTASNSLQKNETSNAPIPTPEPKTPKFIKAHKNAFKKMINAQLSFHSLQIESYSNSGCKKAHKKAEEKWKVALKNYEELCNISRECDATSSSKIPNSDVITKRDFDFPPENVTKDIPSKSTCTSSGTYRKSPFFSPDFFEPYKTPLSNAFSSHPEYYANHPIANASPKPDQNADKTIIEAFQKELHEMKSVLNDTENSRKTLTEMNEALENEKSDIQVELAKSQSKIAHMESEYKHLDHKISEKDAIIQQRMKDTEKTKKFEFMMTTEQSSKLSEEFWNLFQKLKNMNHKLEKTADDDGEFFLTRATVFEDVIEIFGDLNEEVDSLNRHLISASEWSEKITVLEKEIGEMNEQFDKHLASNAANVNAELEDAKKQIEFLQNLSDAKIEALKNSEISFRRQLKEANRKGKSAMEALHESKSRFRSLVAKHEETEQSTSSLYFGEALSRHQQKQEKFVQAEKLSAMFGKEIIMKRFVELHGGNSNHENDDKDSK